MIFSLTKSENYVSDLILISSAGSLYDLWRRLREDADVAFRAVNSDELEVLVFSDYGSLLARIDVTKEIRASDLGAFRRAIKSNAAVQQYISDINGGES